MRTIENKFVVTGKFCNNYTQIVIDGIPVVKAYSRS